MDKINKLFQEVQNPAIDFNTFDMRCTHKTSLQWGKLIPTHVQAMYPGDSIKMNTQHLIRTMPMIAPPMAEVDIYVHNFFVPYRILDPNFEDYIKDAQSDYILPYVKMDNIAPLSIGDHMGLPTNHPAEPSEQKIMAYPFYGYRAIWNEFFRDENLQQELDTPCIEGDNTLILATDGLMGTPFKRAWEHDYFTSCLPFPQKGPAVQLPLGGFADIQFENQSFTKAYGALSGDPIDAVSFLETDAEGFVVSHIDPASNEFVNIDNSASLLANLSTAVGASIEDFRLAMALQAYYELNARTGTRYQEYVKAHWGVDIKDSRIQIPEFLGGGRTKLIISEIQQMSATNATSPQGNLAGQANSLGTTNEISYTAPEWGIMIQLTSIMPRTEYKDMLPRWWQTHKPLDWYDPMFANLGEMAVLRKEVEYQNDGSDDETFGYQSRNADLRFNQSVVTGEMKTNLKFWTLTRDVATPPQLGEEFIQCTPAETIWAVTDDSAKFIAYFQHDIKMGRKMPLMAIPAKLGK